MDYEGYVTYPAGEIYSVQCDEDRHTECPQGPDNPATGVPDEGPIFGGYYCECPHHGDI